VNVTITLSDAITALIAEKRAVGYKYDAEARVLARFEAFSRHEFPGLDTLTEASVQAWIVAGRRRDVKPATLQTLAAPIRELARWLGRHGLAAYLLPRAALPRPARYVPHIYTDAELAALFSQTDRCHYCAEVPLRHLVMPVLFRTIYACGLRCSEARLLRVADADIDAGVLQIRDAKGGRDRQVPVSGPLRARLSDYDARIGGHPSRRDWFFPGSRPGEPLTLVNVNHNFRRFLWQAGISHGGRGHGPRVHDLRHTFRGQQPAVLVRPGARRRRAAAGAADLPGSLVDRRHRLLLAPDRRVLPGHHRSGAAGDRRRRAARDGRTA
jgi:integrase